MPEYKLIPLAQLIEPPMPVRFSMDDEKMAELVASVRVHGVLQNLVVVPDSSFASHHTGEREVEGERARGGAPPLYEIVAGHRRYIAARTAELTEVPCLIFQDKDIARHAAMLDENLCREDITAAEEATMYAELIDKYDYTEEQLLDAVKRPGSYIYARLDLLKGNPAVFEAVKDRKIVLSVAQQLNRVDDAAHCRYLLNMAVEGGATARVVMKWVQDYKANGPGQVVDLEPFRQAAIDGKSAPGPPSCFICGKNNYPSNIVWVPVHDFERDQILSQVQSVAQLPETEGTSR